MTATVQLADANSFTYTSSIEIFGAHKDLIFTVCGRATGTRF